MQHETAKRAIQFLFWLALGLTLALSDLFFPVKSHAAVFRIITTEAETPIVPNSVIELALRMGYYAREGVNVELIRVPATPTAVAALRAGQGEMANISFDVALQIVARNQMPLRAIVSPDRALPFVIVAQKALTSPSQLAGKSFGVGRIGSVDYTQSRTVLSSLGIDVSKMRYIAIGQPAIRAQAMIAGQIDATTITLGTLATIENRAALNVLVDHPAYYAAAPFITKLSVVPADIAKSRAAEIASIVRATILLSRDFAADPARWVGAMVQARPDLPRTQLEELSIAYRDSWSVNGGLSLEDAQVTQTALAQTDEFKDIPVGLKASDWVDMSFIDEVLSKYGRLPVVESKSK